MHTRTDNIDTSLPQPSAEEVEHSLRLIARIKEEMSSGMMPFSRFMELALYAPGLGYYSAGKTKFGEAGDFITAPEMGSVFARCMARQCAQVLAELGGGDLLEAGGGSGALAVELLAELERLQQLPANYYLLELSADLREQQRRRINAAVPHLVQRVHWLDQLPEGGFEGVVLANELLDAMPVTLFHVTGDGIMERCITDTENGFAWVDRPGSEPLRQRVDALNLHPGYQSEINFAAEAWIHSLADVLQRGLMLIIDYGFPDSEYFHPQRADGTLMCHYRHRAHTDPLKLVGLQDITAHVDFTAMAHAAVDSGLDVLGYTALAPFLMASGLAELMAQSDPDEALTHLQMTGEIKKLTLPSEMGELFKVLAVAKEWQTPLTGFLLQDRRGRL